MSSTSTLVHFPVRIWQIVWYSLIALVGLIGNSLVLYLAFSKKKGGINKRAPFNIYMITLAIVDLLISLFCIPIYLLSTDIFNHPGGTGGEWLCKIVTGYFFPFWMLDISAFLLVAIALERRRALIHPFSTLHESRISRTLSVVGGVVILSIVTQTPAIYGSHYVSSFGTVGSACVYLYGEVWMQIMYYNSFILGCVFPLIIFTVCFYQIHKQLSKTSTSLNTTLEAYANSSLYKKKVRSAMKRTKQTINTIRLVIIAFVVFVTINEVFFNIILKPTLNVINIQWNSQIYQVTVMLRFTNSGINPILYGFKSQVFRKRLKELFCVASSSKRINKRRQLRLHHHLPNALNGNLAPTPYDRMPKTPSNII